MHVCVCVCVCVRVCVCVCVYCAKPVYRQSARMLKPHGMISFAGTRFVSVTRLEVHATCRVQRIFFCDRVYDVRDLPKGYALTAPSPE